MANEHKAEIGPQYTYSIDEPKTELSEQDKTELKNSRDITLLRSISNKLSLRKCETLIKKKQYKKAMELTKKYGERWHHEPLRNTIDLIGQIAANLQDYEYLDNQYYEDTVACTQHLGGRNRGEIFNIVFRNIGSNVAVENYMLDFRYTKKVPPLHILEAIGTNYELSKQYLTQLKRLPKKTEETILKLVVHSLFLYEGVKILDYKDPQFHKLALEYLAKRNPTGIEQYAHLYANINQPWAKEFLTELAKYKPQIFENIFTNYKKYWRKSPYLLTMVSIGISTNKDIQNTLYTCINLYKLDPKKFEKIIKKYIEQNWEKNTHSVRFVSTTLTKSIKLPWALKLEEKAKAKEKERFEKEKQAAWASRDALAEKSAQWFKPFDIMYKKYKKIEAEEERLWANNQEKALQYNRNVKYPFLFKLCQYEPTTREEKIKMIELINEFSGKMINKYNEAENVFNIKGFDGKDAYWMLLIKRSRLEKEVYGEKATTPKFVDIYERKND